MLDVVESNLRLQSTYAGSSASSATAGSKRAYKQAKSTIWSQYRAAHGSIAGVLSRRSHDSLTARDTAAAHLSRSTSSLLLVGLDEPILDPQAGDAGEVEDVARNERGIARQRDRRDPQVGLGDSPPGELQLGA